MSKVLKSNNFEQFPICEYLLKSEVSFDLFLHPPIFTVREGEEFMRDVPGHGTKNLFLRDKKGKIFLLLTVCEEKRVDLTALGSLLGIGRLSFGSPERLREHLGVEPGSVTLLALFNNRDHSVRFLIDQDLWAKPTWQCHPLRNDASLVISPDGIKCFLRSLGHEYQSVLVPEILGQ